MNVVPLNFKKIYSMLMMCIIIVNRLFLFCQPHFANLFKCTFTAVVGICSIVNSVDEIYLFRKVMLLLLTFPNDFLKKDILFVEMPLLVAYKKKLLGYPLLV